MILAALCVCLALARAGAGQDRDTPPKPTEGDAAGLALYQKMIEAIRKADSLTYTSRYEMKADKLAIASTYRVWLKKPNFFRVETESAALGPCGILIGDGHQLWIHWPQGRPFVDADSPEDKKTQRTSYLTKPAPPGGHSIGHETGLLGSGLTMPIIDPSTFHGYTDSLQPYLDGVTSLPEEKVGTEECDHILVNFMKHQRSWEIWLSQADHLPRKLQQIVHVKYDIIMNEEWSDITTNADIPDAQFAWKPPADWTEWRMPTIEDGLLKPGAVAPEFELASSIPGIRIKLSDFRGKNVWFYVWRAG